MQSSCLQILGVEKECKNVVDRRGSGTVCYLCGGLTPKNDETLKFMMILGDTLYVYKLCETCLERHPGQQMISTFLFAQNVKLQAQVDKLSIILLGAIL
jgi:hypothetical protein